MFTDVTAEIIADRILHNVRRIRAVCGPNVRLCAPLKADAYGHGMRIVAPLLQTAGADCAAVAQLDEAVELRRFGWTRPILILGNVLAISSAAERRERLEAVIEHDCMLTLADAGHLGEISAAACAAQRPIDLHLKIDTGMGRMGFLPVEGVEVLRRIRATPGARLTGVFSHLASADDPGQSELTNRQVAEFRAFLDANAMQVGGGVVRHLANTAAMLTRSDTHLDMVRTGIGLFGCFPSAELEGWLDLQPAMRVVSHVAIVKELPPGHCVGYGCKYTTTRHERIGIVPVGYHDGYIRALSNVATVGLASGDARVVGRVSMDQIAINLTHLPLVRSGDVVTLIDERSERPNSTENLAKLIGTIPYEVLCLVGPRVRRTLVPASNDYTAERYEIHDSDGLNQPHKFGRLPRQERGPETLRPVEIPGDSHEVIETFGQV